MPAQPQTAPPQSARSRPSPLALADQLRDLAACYLILGMMRDYRPRSSGAPGAGMAAAPLPVFAPAIEARRGIEGFATEYLAMLVRETPWRPPARTAVPDLLVQMAGRIGHWSEHANALVAWAFAEDLDLVLERALLAERLTRKARIPIGRGCDVDGCDGVFELHMSSALVEADDAARERAFTRSWPRAVCSKRSAHRSEPLDLRSPDAEVTTTQLAEWFAVTRKTVLQRMRAEGVRPVREDGSKHEKVWDRTLALVVMTRQRVVR